MVAGAGECGRSLLQYNRKFITKQGSRTARERSGTVRLGGMHRAWPATVLVAAVLLWAPALGAHPRPEPSDFEMLEIVAGDTGAPMSTTAHRGRQHPFVLSAAQHAAITEAQWNAVDAQLLDRAPAHPQMLSAGDYEPYSDELDSEVTISGMPDSLVDGDSVLHNRYEDWIRNYKRIPNEPEVPWSYGGPDSGPDLWSTLNKDFQMCDPDLTGKMSSPINIPTDRAQPACYGPSFRIKNGPVYEGDAEFMGEFFDRSFIIDTHHCEQECKICVDKCVEAPRIAATADHKKMELDRIVFHTPSEHKFDNEAADLELQFLHCTLEDHHVIPCAPSLAFAVLFKDGGPSYQNPEWMNKLFRTLNKISSKPKSLAKGLDIHEITETVNADLVDYYNYVGSQTYPPCYQGVQWMVGKQVLTVSTSIIEGFKMRQGENVRPVFPLGRRQLLDMRKEEDSHWTYEGPRGEEWWPNYIGYASCGNGAPDCEKLPNQKARDKCIAESRAQSPIDIYTNECQPNVQQRPCVKPVGLRPIKFDVGSSSSKQLLMYIKDLDCGPGNLNNAYTYAVTVPGNVRLTYLNSVFTLREMEFHTPTEHAFDGMRKDMELQFKMDRTGCLQGGCKSGAEKLHLSILFEKGETSPQFVEQLALAASSATGRPEPLIPDLKFIDISVALHPLLSTYFFYEGSLSTPPCSAQVTWLVVKTVLSVKEEHLSMINEVIPNGGTNARSLQDLNGRLLSVAGTVQL